MLLVLGIMAVTAVSTVRNSEDTIDWVYHTLDFMLGVKSIETDLNAGEASLQRYVLTRDSKDQDAYRFHLDKQMVKSDLPVVKALAQYDPAVRDRVLTLEGLLVNRVDLARDLVTTLTNQGDEAARKQLLADAGSPKIMQIYLEVKAMLDDQRAVISQRVHAANMAARDMRWIIWVGLGFSFLLLVMMSWLISDDITARRRAMRAMEEANAILEQKVQERTSELVKANKDLTKENLERQWSEQALSHQLGYINLIINSIGESVIVVSMATNITRINRALLHVTGYEEHEVVGQPLAKLLAIEGPAAGTDLSFSQALKESREIQDRPARLLCKSGSCLLVRYSMVSFRDGNNVVGGALTVRLVT
jgi:PAS domain S-box-containing protein